MPELPEIETARARLHAALVGRKIAKVIVDRDDYICFDEAEPGEVARALRGAVITGSGRKGKYLWLKLDRKPWLVLHMGMTGNVEIRRRKKNGKSYRDWGWGGKALWSGHAGDGLSVPGKPPRFSRLFLLFDNGIEVAITDPRRFGRIRLSDDPESSAPIRRLGFDPLHGFPSAKALAAILARRRLAIKAALLDQKIFAGVGNWIADEVLYQARIDPHRLTAHLSPAQVSALRTKLLSIVRLSVRRGGRLRSLP